jgi:phosphatidylinositol-3-phosphatase
MRRALLALALLLAPLGLTATPAGATGLPAPGTIKHILVIDLENESFANVFSNSSPATYLTGPLEKDGVLITHYYATAHVSLPNYIAQVSGQAPTPTTQLDCGATFDNVAPGTVLTGANALGQVKAKKGCVYPNTVATIADQLDQISPPDPTTHKAAWRAYEEDMGNNATRDNGTTCAHPAIGAANTTQFAQGGPTGKNDGYAARHDPFVWFHSMIDQSAECQANVVPLGTYAHKQATGPLADDLSSTATTPAFGFISPSLCNDGHDEVCASKSAAGGTTGGLVAANAWLKHWMPVILSSPAYTEGSMLVVITMDEAGIGQKGSGNLCCGELPGPNVSQAGGVFGAGGGQIGALVLGPSSLIAPGTKDTTGRYNHYSALRTYEDLLGITTGGSDGLGHLGMAGAPGLATFGTDVFNAS